jgi:hypothetical protein
MVLSMGDLMFWFGLVLGVIIMAIGLAWVLRRRTMSAKSPTDSRWHISERFGLVGGIVLMVAGALVIASRLL